MKKLYVIIISLLILSCNDPVFYSISEEEEPLDPKIAGPSTNFVLFKNSLYDKDNMYVASGRNIYCYNTAREHIAEVDGNEFKCYCNNNSEHETKGYIRTPQWSSTPVSGRITHLAATTSTLYALSGNKILSFTASDTLTPGESITIPDHNIQGIYAVKDTLFISTFNNSEEAYNVRYINDGETESTPVVIVSDGSFSMLCGAASDGINYYLCNKDNNGIFVMSTLGEASLVEGSVNREFTNIINIDNTVAAMTRGGRLFKVALEGVEQIASFSDGRKATSALGVWKNADNTVKLILAGRQDLTNSISTGYTHGYVETVFDADTLTVSSFREPGNTSSSSMKENTNGHYTNSIGKHGVNYFCQAPDGILFASLNHGVWSYRERSSNKFTWNAEN